VCKDRINEIEPGTIKYEDRIGLLKRLKERNIPNSVVLKPLLPFIDLDVYKVIIDETSIYTNSYLIGDLYVNIKSKFYEYYVKDKYEIHKREVLWLPDKKTWYVVVDNIKKSNIEKYINKLEKNVFHSDVEHLEFLNKVYLDWCHKIYE
jgi:DNA repair photolyase